MHFDNLFFILLGLAFVVLRWLAQRATDSKKEPPRQEPERPTRTPAESEEERLRRFMEALGNPAGSKPPPKVTPRPVQQPRSAGSDAKGPELERQRQPPRRSVWTAPLPPLTTTPPPESAPTRVTRPRLIKTPPIEQKTLPPLSPAARFEVVEQTSAPSLPPPSAYVTSSQRQAGVAIPADVQTLLSSPGGLRNAVILREILGRPRALQPFEI